MVHPLTQVNLINQPSPRPTRENGPNFGFTNNHARKHNNFQVSCFVQSSAFLSLHNWVKTFKKSTSFYQSWRGQILGEREKEKSAQHWMTLWKSKLSPTAYQKQLVYSFNQVTFWRIFYRVIQKLTRLTCKCGYIISSGKYHLHFSKTKKSHLNNSFQ